MSSSDEYREQSPAFEQPDGVGSLGEPTVPLGDVHPSSDSWSGESPYSSAAPDHTLPMVDLYPTTDNWAGSSPYALGNDYGNPAPAQQPSAGAMAPYPVVDQQTQQWAQQPGPYAQQPGPYVQQPGPYGQQPGLYGQQPGPYRMVRPDHPQATTVVVLGAVSVGVPVLSFVAWYMGSKAKAEIDRGAPYAYGGNLKVGHILGKVIGILTIVGGSLYGLFLIAYLVLMFGLLAM